MQTGVHLSESGESRFLGQSLNSIIYDIFRAANLETLSLCEAFQYGRVAILKQHDPSGDSASYYGIAFISRDFEPDFRKMIAPYISFGKLTAPNYPLYEDIIMLFDWSPESAIRGVRGNYLSSGKNPLETVKAMPFRQTRESSLSEVLISLGYNSVEMSGDCMIFDR